VTKLDSDYIPSTPAQPRDEVEEEEEGENCDAAHSGDEVDHTPAPRTKKRKFDDDILLYGLPLFSPSSLPHTHLHPHSSFDLILFFAHLYLTFVTYVGFSWAMQITCVPV
jgi:hypothetical protein